MNNYLMVDMETLALDNPVVIQLGYVVFNKKEILWESRVNVCPKSCVELGLVQDLDTLAWWLRTNPELLSSILEGGSTGITLALRDMFTVYNNFGCKGVMSNGALADILWINQIVDKAKRAGRSLEIPWSYKEELCFRTIRALFPKYKGVEFGEKHDAINDARYQASVVQEIVNKEGVAL